MEPHIDFPYDQVDHFQDDSTFDSSALLGLLLWINKPSGTLAKSVRLYAVLTVLGWKDQVEAARDLDVTKAAISKTVHELERDLNLKFRTTKNQEFRASLSDLWRSKHLRQRSSKASQTRLTGCTTTH